MVQVATITVKARVVGVRPREDGSFGVTLGPGPKIFWYRTESPPKLGQLVLVKDAGAVRLRLQSTDKGQVTLLEGGRMSVLPDPWARRVVAAQWVRRAHELAKRPLFPYQAEGAGWLASRLVRRQSSILGDDPGCGKTSQVLTAIAAVGATPAIVICPTSLKQNWAREVQYLKPNLRVAVLEGTKGPIPPAHIVVANYALLKSRALQFVSLRARVIVFDEAHLLKEPSPSATHRAAVATRLAHTIGASILMTGTPLLNRPQELWRLLHTIDRHTWPEYQRFRRRYCTSVKKDEHHVRAIVTSHGQAKRVDELRALVQPFMLRRIRGDVLKDKLPKKSRRRVLIELHPFDRQNYDAAEKDVLKWLTQVTNDSTRAENAKRGQAVVKLNMLRRIAALGKLRSSVKTYLEAWFESENRPLVVFAYHKQVLLGTRQICKSLGLRISKITGQDSTDERQGAVDAFQQGKTDVFIAPIKSAGVGLNLQRACDMLFLERLWTPALMGQAESRCHRLGQTKEVSVTYLDAAKTVDEHIANVLRAKQRLIDEVVDDKQAKSYREQTIETIDEVIGKFSGGRWAQAG